MTSAVLARAGLAVGPVVRRASALMMSTVASAALGFAFWLVAARFLPAHTVGLGAALVSSMTLLASLAQLNLASLYARFLPTAGPRTRSLVLGGAAAATATGVVGAVAFAALGQDTGRWPWLFGVAVVVSALHFIADGVLNGLGRAAAIPIRTVAASAGKLVLLGALGVAGVHLSGEDVLLVWTVPVVVVVAATSWVVLRRLVPAHAHGPSESIDRREIVRFAGAEYVNAIVANLVSFLPPVLVTATVGADLGAYFYLPWLIGVSVTTMLWNIVTSYVATASGTPSAEERWRHLTRAIRLGAVVALGGAALLAAAATPLLWLLGPAYAEHGATALRLIGATLPFTAVGLLFAALRFMRKRLGLLTLLQAVAGTLFLGGTVASVERFGIVAPAAAYLVAQALLALLVAPFLARDLRALRPKAGAPAALAGPDAGPGRADWMRRAAQWLRRRPAVDPVALLILTLVVFVGSSALAAWTGWWHPVVGGLLTALVAGGGGALAVWQRRPRRRPLRVPRPGWGGLAHVATLSIALVAWLVSLAHTDVTRVGQLGLLAALPPLFLVAVVATLAGFVVEVRRPGAPRRVILAAYLGLAILLVHATTPLLLEEPQYAWTYKHVGVVEYVLTHGHVSGGADIYQQWPAFFTAVAALVDLLGVSALAVAPWAPAVFTVLNATLVGAIARTLGGDVRMRWSAVLAYVGITWVAQDYLAPQALAFALSLGVFYLVLRYLRPGVGSRRSRAAAIVLVALTTAVLAATHQLSPYLVTAVVVAFVVAGVVRPWWVAPLVGVIPVLYLLPRYGFVTGSFSLLDGLNLFANASGNGGTWGSTGQAVSAIAVRTLSLAVWAGAAFAVWRSGSRWRRPEILVPALGAVVPFGLLLAQSYGGEAIYRVFLFSAPWCSLLLVGRWGPLRPRPWTSSLAGRLGARRVLSTAAVVGLATLALLSTMQGRHGQLMVDRQVSAEVAAARYLYAHAQPGATVILATPNFPSRLAANYGEFNRSVVGPDPDLVPGAGLRDIMFGAQHLPVIESYAASIPGHPTYLVVSDGMHRYATYFGALPDGSLDALERTLQRDPQWTVWYDNGEVTIYEWSVEPAPRPEAPPPAHTDRVSG
jgi:O-antigen/teichoic acid export membrane protein